jgi:hypothetical protein
LNRSLLASSAAVALLALSGCAGASVTQLWRNPDYGTRPVSRVFVVATTPRGVEPSRFENGVAQALVGKGFQAATASGVFPPGRLDKVKVKEYVDGNKIDLLVMVHVTSEAAKPVTVTSTVAASSGWYGAYGTTAATTTRVIEGTDFVARVDVFDVRTDPDMLAWSGESNAVSAQGAGASLGEALVNELVKARVLVK